MIHEEIDHETITNRIRFLTGNGEFKLAGILPYFHGKEMLFELRQIDLLMDFVPLYEFHKCVQRYNGHPKVKTFSCWDQFLTMAFAQLTYRESLRDIQASTRGGNQAVSLGHSLPRLAQYQSGSRLAHLRVGTKRQ